MPPSQYLTNAVRENIPGIGEGALKVFSVLTGAEKITGTADEKLADETFLKEMGNVVIQWGSLNESKQRILAEQLAEMRTSDNTILINHRSDSIWGLITRSCNIIIKFTKAIKRDFRSPVTAEDISMALDILYKGRANLEEVNTDVTNLFPGLRKSEEA